MQSAVIRGFIDVKLSGSDEVVLELQWYTGDVEYTLLRYKFNHLNKNWWVHSIVTCKTFKQNRNDRVEHRAANVEHQIPD